MNHLESLRSKIIKTCPDIVELEFGCYIQNVFWYGSEADKKKGVIDWIKTGHFKNGREGTVVKDLRSDFLPMWVDYGDQVDFTIEADDIVSFEIIGRPITLEDVMRTLNFDLNGYIYANNAIYCAPLIDKKWVNDNKICDWLLGKPLDQQPQETIKSLDELIKEDKTNIG